MSSTSTNNKNGPGCGEKSCFLMWLQCQILTHFLCWWSSRLSDLPDSSWCVFNICWIFLQFIFGCCGWSHMDSLKKLLWISFLQWLMTLMLTLNIISAHSVPVSPRRGWVPLRVFFLVSSQGVGVLVTVTSSLLIRDLHFHPGKLLCVNDKPLDK